MPKALFAIFALGENDALGRGGGLPWNYPEDSKQFDDVTRGHAVIMGRRTWQERGVPLSDRTNIVVSRTLSEAEGMRVAPNLPAALEMAYLVDPTPFVIGGAALFKEAMPLVRRVYLTRIPETPVADTFYAFDASPFEVKSSRRTEDGVVFTMLERKAPPAP